MLLFPKSELVKTPYYIRSLSIRIYTIEELAYIITDEALRIDEGFMKKELVDFVGRDLGCRELAEKLEYYRQDNNLAMFCRAILLYTEFVAKDRIEQLTELFTENQSLSPGKRFLRRGNYYMQNDLVMQAMAEYHKALKEFGAIDDKEKYALVLHNLGTGAAKIFDFEMAAKYYLESYELSLDEETYNLYLASLRLGNSKDEYLNLIKTKDIAEEKVKELEDWIGVLLTQSSQDDIYKRFNAALQKKRAGDASECYVELMEILNIWKNECRRNLEIENI